MDIGIYKLEEFDPHSNNNIHDECRKFYTEAADLETRSICFDSICNGSSTMIRVHISEDSITSQTIAVGLLDFQTSYVRIDGLLVQQKHRYQGVGESILRHAIKIVDDRYIHLVLIVFTPRLTVEFFQKYGFTSVGSNFVLDGVALQLMIYKPRYDRISSLEILKCHSLDFTCDADYNIACSCAIQEFLLHMKENFKLRLLHLQFSIETEVVSRSLLRVYRECAFALIQQNFERSIELEKFGLDHTWMMLNTGHYGNVNDAWRELYSIFSACRAVRFFDSGNLKEALLACDKGLIMGGDIDGNSLSTYAHYIHSLIPLPLAHSIHKVSSSKLPHPLVNSEPVRQLENPSLEDFYHVIAAGEPVLLRGLISAWPACSKWSLEYLLKLMGHRTMPIEIGSSYAGEDWMQNLMTFSEFITEFIVSKNDHGTGYLAQHRLFDQIPQLLNDLFIPDYCAFGSGGIGATDLNIWLGPSDTISPLHSDPRANIFCQVRGRKFFRLISYRETDFVYAHSEGYLTNTSQVDVENPDLSQYPLFAKAHVFDCIVNGGDSLYIPTKYWHYVRSLDQSVSVSCWFKVDD